MTPKTSKNNNDYSEWTTLNFNEAGTYEITARATVNAGNQNWFSVNVKVQLQAEEPIPAPASQPLSSGPGTTKPSVKTTLPMNNAMFTIPASDGTVDVAVTGTASDGASGSGVNAVEEKVTQNDANCESYKSTLPKAANDYSEWTMSLSFDKPGTYEITARAADYAGNQSWATATITIRAG